MWLEFFRFDLRYQLRQPLLWVAGVLMGVVGFFLIYSDSAQAADTLGNIHRNAPLVLARNFGLFSLLSMFIVTVFIGGAVLRDTELGMAELIFATPMRKRDYLFGRFAAGLLASMVIFLLIGLGMALGSIMPGNDVTRAGPFAWQPYWWSFTVLVLPNLFFMGAMQVWLAATSRSMLYVYLGILLFFGLWLLGGMLARNIANEWAFVLIDPFGIQAMGRMTRYYSVAEANTTLPPFAGFLLWNRLLWAGVSITLLGFALHFFRPQRAGTRRRWFQRTRPDVTITRFHDEPVPLRTHLQFSYLTSLKQCWRIASFDLLGVIRSLPFLVMLALSILLFLWSAYLASQVYGTRSYPVTFEMLQALAIDFSPILVLTVIFYAGELIFKERQSNLSEVTDAMPMPDWVPLVAKAAALVAVVATFMASCAVVAVGVQLYRGGVPLEPGLYLQGLLFESLYYVLMGLMALAVHAIAGNKYLGHLIIIAMWLMQIVLSVTRLEHNLYYFASLPPLPYSDFNGWDHFLTAFAWFGSYWILFSVLVFTVAQALSIRGMAAGWRKRLHLARLRLRGAPGRTAMALLLALAMVGGWIYYNTCVLNDYASSQTLMARQVRYEKLYRQYQGRPQPHITDVRVNVDIYPDTRAADIVGHYRLVNRSATPIDTLYMRTNPLFDTKLTHLPKYHTEVDDRIVGFRILHLAEPVAPGGVINMDFTVAVRNPGFTNEQGLRDDLTPMRPGSINVTNNGTMLDSDAFFPHLGYDPGLELADRTQRHRYGLGEPAHMAGTEDINAIDRNVVEPDADWVRFDATVSTSAEQVAIAPGELLGTWDKGGRRYFHYVVDTPALARFAFLSGDWQTETNAWRDIPIEIDYDAKHPYNIEHMREVIAKSLDYYTDNFGPYAFRQVRVVEYPRYAPLVLSSAGTIPLHEDVAFIADLRDKDGIDDVAFQIAERVAEQWWTHQAVGADTQGGSMISDSLPQYCAMMVMEKMFGRDHLRRFLRHELDRYLTSRSEERIEEEPLFRAEGQSYITRNKGALVFYRLRNEIGETALNRALANFLRDNRYRAQPFPTSFDLLAYIRAETPPEKQEIVTDLFQRMVFYDNRVVEASATARSDGRWDVTMKLHLRKYQQDGAGQESPRFYDEPVDVAVFARAPDGKERHEKTLVLESRLFTEAEPTVKLTVNERPYEVGVDPFNVLIDRVPSDNRKKVSIE